MSLDIQATTEAKYSGENPRIRVIGFGRMAEAISQSTLQLPLDGSENLDQTVNFIRLERKTKSGSVRVIIDPRGGQIVSYRLNEIEFISPDGPTGNIYETGDTERGRWPQNSPQSGLDPEGFWPFHGILNRIQGEDVSTSKEIRKGQATLAFTGQNIKFALREHYSALAAEIENVKSTKIESNAISLQAKHLSQEEFEERLAKIDDASGIFVNYDIADDGGVIVTQQIAGLGEAAPGMHPYFPTFGIESWRALQLQAHKFGLSPEEVSYDSLKKGFRIPLDRAMSLAQENGDKTITFYLDEAQTIGVELTPEEGSGKDSILAIWGDGVGRICLEFVNAGFGALGKGLDTLQTNWCGIFSTKVRAFAK